MVKSAEHPMDADLHAVLGIAKLDARMRTSNLIRGVLSRQFVDAHPRLVRMLQSPHLRADVVEELVERLKSIREGREDLHEASVAVGQALVDAYISRGRDSTANA